MRAPKGKRWCSGTERCPRDLGCAAVLAHQVFGVCNRTMALDLAEGPRATAAGMKPTDLRNPNYFHKVVDCQWACPAHTPVPEYIRLIAEGRYTDAYMINWW